MSRRKYNKNNYKYPKENDADGTSKNDKEKKQLKKKIIDCKSIDELIEETKDIYR